MHELISGGQRVGENSTWIPDISLEPKSRIIRRSRCCAQRPASATNRFWEIHQSSISSSKTKLNYWPPVPSHVSSLSFSRCNARLWINMRQISSWPCSFSSSVDLSHMQAWHVSSILKCCRMEWIMSWICSHQPECQQHCKVNPSPVLMLERPSSYSSLFSTIHLSMLLFSYPSIFEYCVSIYCISFFLPSIILHIFLATHPSVHPSAILFIFLIIHLSFYISNMSIHPPSHPSI